MRMRRNLELENRSGEALVNTDNTAIVILLADDDEEDLMLTAEALRLSKVVNELKTVSDGEDLMDYLYHRGKHAPPVSSPRPGLVLLDLNMPKKDGKEALRAMKADPALRSIPVVILTTSQSAEDVERTLSLGASSFIVKPVTFDRLARAVRVATEYWFEIVQLPTGAK
jgi:CheY-like chemotaxis protein